MSLAASGMEWVNWVQQHQYVLFILLLIPLLLLAWWRRIYPALLMAALLAAPCLMAVLLLLDSSLWPFVVAADLLILAAAVVDLVTMTRQGAFEAHRETGRIVSLRQSHGVAITIYNRSSLSRTVQVRDDVPEQFAAEPAEFSERIAAQGRKTFRYELRASRRGAFELRGIYVRARSFLGLWQRLLFYPVSNSLHVYPDMKQLSEFAVLARTNRLSLMGVRRTRRIGQDHEFERLRDYTPDDNYKHIDWRSTARRQKLTVKDFQSSQSQRIIFLVDCGRMMTNEASGISLLDHSLNAMLMLSYVALRQGDSVGLISFSDEIHNFLPPQGGLAHMNQLLHASFDRFPRLVESRYDQAFLYLSTKCRKRSLVVLISNLIDEVNANQLQQYLSSMAGRHLPLGVLLRDHRMFDAADIEKPTGRDLFRSAAAADILSWRRQVLADLEHRGVLSLDVFPEEMTARLVNRYLEIKARHLL